MSRHRRSFAPKLYPGATIAGEILWCVEHGQGDYVTLDPLVTELEGAMDAPWCAVVLASAVGKDKLMALPERIAARLLALMQRASGANKPVWVEQALAGGASDQG